MPPGCRRSPGPRRRPVGRRDGCAAPSRPRPPRRRPGHPGASGGPRREGRSQPQPRRREPASGRGASPGDGTRWRGDWRIARIGLGSDDAGLLPGARLRRGGHDRRGAGADRGARPRRADRRRRRRDDFGIEPEITAKVCRRKLRVYELPVSYYGRSYADGKKITWRDGFKAVWVLVAGRLARERRAAVELPTPVPEVL